LIRKDWSLTYNMQYIWMAKFMMVYDER